MRKIYKFFIPAFVAVVLCSACETSADVVMEEVKVEESSEMPPKSTIRIPPRL